MAVEIERKFLVSDDRWRALAGDRHHIEQAYLAVTDQTEIRVRIVDGAVATLTVKSARPDLARQEFEIDIGADEARSMMDMQAGSRLEKYRHRVTSEDGRTWEIDEFLGDLCGLVLAEVELPDATEEIALFEWLGEEVTGDPAYYNAVLAKA